MAGDARNGRRPASKLKRWVVDAGLATGLQAGGYQTDTRMGTDKRGPRD